MDKLMTNIDPEEERILRDFFQQNTQAPPTGLTEEVMRRVEERSKIFVYEPVLSPKILWSLGGAFVAVLIILFMQLDGTSYYYQNIYEIATNLLTDRSVQLLTGLNSVRLPEIPMLFQMVLAILVIFGIHLMMALRRFSKMR